MARGLTNAVSAGKQGLELGEIGTVDDNTEYYPCNGASLSYLQYPEIQNSGMCYTDTTFEEYTPKLPDNISATHVSIFRLEDYYNTTLKITQRQYMAIYMTGGNQWNSKKYVSSNQGWVSNGTRQSFTLSSTSNLYDPILLKDNTWIVAQYISASSMRLHRELYISKQTQGQPPKLSKSPLLKVCLSLRHPLKKRT